jgi:hypothetical protein
VIEEDDEPTNDGREIEVMRGAGLRTLTVAVLVVQRPAASQTRRVTRLGPGLLKTTVGLRSELV